MTEKRFKNIGNDIWQGNEVWCVAGGEHCADVIATALNEVLDENEQLKKENKELRQYLGWQDMELEEMEDIKR